MRAWAEQGLSIALLPDFAVDTALESGTPARIVLPAPDLRLRLPGAQSVRSLPGCATSAG
jgi:DNA-binding transcriptional LysR family regulator